MYKMVKNVIEQGNFELSDILKKIDTFWVKGNVTEEERTELIELAQIKANPQNSVDIMRKLEELDMRVKEIEKYIRESEDTETPDIDTEPEISTVEHPEFEIGKWYYAGDTISFEDKVYTCVAPEGAVCVWSPKDYPMYWKLAE